MAEQEKEIKQKEAEKPDNTIFIGEKPFMNYIT